MTNVVDLENNTPHEVSELICLKCLHRWIGVYPADTLLKNLECRCGEVGYVIKTGQTIIENLCEKCANYKDKCTLGLTKSEFCEYFRKESE